MNRLSRIKLKCVMDKRKSSEKKLSEYFAFHLFDYIPHDLKSKVHVVEEGRAIN